MPSIRDIINAATPGPWSGIARNKNRGGVWANAKIGWVTDDEQFGDFCLPDDALFIAEMNPTHAGLMEDVVEACRAIHPDTEIPFRLALAMDALSAYRKERGLDD